MFTLYAPLMVGILVGGFTLLSVANGLYFLAFVLLLVGLGNRVGLVLVVFHFGGRGNEGLRKGHIITSLFVGGVLVGLGLGLLRAPLSGEEGGNHTPALVDRSAKEQAGLVAYCTGLETGLLLGVVFWAYCPWG